MKKTSLFICSLFIGSIIGFGQELKLPAGAVEIEIKDEKKRSRLMGDDGSTKCGFYDNSTKTFFDCSGKSESADPSKILSGADCCSRITLGAGTLEVSGALKVDGDRATITGDGVIYYLDLPKLTSAESSKVFKNKKEVKLDIKLL